VLSRILFNWLVTHYVNNNDDGGGDDTRVNTKF